MLDGSWNDGAGTGDADDRNRDENHRRGNAGPEADLDRTFLRVDGMYSATCEAYLESVAEGCDGVTDAAASYVTETIRIEHDPERIGTAELCNALSPLGYSATPREGTEDAGAVERRAGSNGRGMDDLLGFRYAAGIIFATFLLVPYAVMVYPAHLSTLFDWEILQLFTGAFGFGTGGTILILPFFVALTSVVLFFTGGPLLRGAYVSLKMRQPTTDLLVSMTVIGAFLYSTAALLLNRTDVYYDLTVVIAAGVVAATFYESLGKQRALDLLTDLTFSQVEEARLYDADGTTTTVAVDDLDPGDRVLVREGERSPVDGVLDDGTCTVDEAVVTGESLPVRTEAGDEVVGGSVVTDGAAVIRVGDGATSSIDQLTTALWDLQSATHGVQRRADGLASLLVPAVAAVAVIVGGAALGFGAALPEALLAFLLVFVVASPWALGLATPLSVASSIEEAMANGIVVFDETVFERLRDVDVVVFDKTGTLTTGEMDVVEADAPGDVLAAAAELERRASHPAADAIVTAFAHRQQAESEMRSDGGVSEEYDREQSPRVQEFRSHPTGVEGTVDDTEILVGNLNLFDARGWSVSDEIEARAVDARSFGRLSVIVGRDGTAEGLVVVGDEPREGWDETVSRLSERGIEIVVLTGDDEAATEFFTDHPSVDHVFAGVPPAGKTEAIRRLQADEHVTMVGDGTNDAPALARADLGISLGSGTALASEAADVAIVDDDLTVVETAFDLAFAARRRVRQNNGLALLYNGIAIPLAAAGLLNPLFAMAAVVASSVPILANSSRDLLD